MNACFTLDLVKKPLASNKQSLVQRSKPRFITKKLRWSPFPRRAALSDSVLGESSENASSAETQEDAITTTTREIINTCDFAVTLTPVVQPCQPPLFNTHGNVRLGGGRGLMINTDNIPSTLPAIDEETPLWHCVSGYPIDIPHYTTDKTTTTRLFFNFSWRTQNEARTILTELMIQFDKLHVPIVGSDASDYSVLESVSEDVVRRELQMSLITGVISPQLYKLGRDHLFMNS
jgi:hypothetical protein